MACSLIACIDKATAVAAGTARDRWLVLASENGRSHIETYRHIYSQLSISTGFRKILMVFAEGLVETLAG
jgi:hypothetical protein